MGRPRRAGAQALHRRERSFRAAFAYTRLGAARALLDDRTGRPGALTRATVLHPRYALPFAWLGYLAYQEGDQAVAAMLLKKAIIDLGPPDATVAAVARFTSTKSDRARIEAGDGLRAFAEECGQGPAPPSRRC